MATGAGETGRGTRTGRDPRTGPDDHGRDAGRDPLYALAWSGGKDSALALDRAVRGGVRVSCLLNIYEGSSGRVRFHGVRRELIASQARHLGLDIVQRATHPDDFETVFTAALDDLRARGVHGIIFGDIHLADVREWYEARTRGRGFEHIEPLWGEPPPVLLREFVDRGYRSMIVSVDLERGDPAWLGRALDAELVAELLSTPGIDPSGEHGEYHSFTFDGPLFERPVPFRPGRRIEMEGHGLLDLERS